MAASKLRTGAQAGNSAEIIIIVWVGGINSSVDVDVEQNDTDSDFAKKVQDAWNAGTNRPATVARNGAELTFTCGGSDVPSYSTQENGGSASIVPTHPAKHTYGCSLQVWVVP